VHFHHILEIKVAGAVYQAHIQGTVNMGSRWGSFSIGQSKRVKAIRLNPLGMEMEVSAHIQDEGRKDYCKKIYDNSVIICGI